MKSQSLETRKWNLLTRAVCLAVLSIFTPLFLYVMYRDEKYVALFCGLALLILVLPDLFAKLFYRPVSAFLNKAVILVVYYHDVEKVVPLSKVRGYVLTEETTRYGVKNGVSLYLNNGRQICFTEINIVDLTPLVEYLKENEVNFLGFQRLRPWFAKTGKIYYGKEAENQKEDC